MKIVNSALEYREAGFSVIPMSPRTKRPLLKWTEFQKRLPEESEVVGWWAKNPAAMCGIVTGAISGISVVDCDSPEACARIDALLPEAFETPIAETPRGGRHYYFKHPEGLNTKTAVLEKVDLRANGGVIVCPPSVNAGGKKYRWLDGLPVSRESLPAMPDALLALLTCDLQGAPYNKNILRGDLGESGFLSGADDKRDDTPTLFSEGRRDNDLFTLANSLVKSGMAEADVFKYLEFCARAWGETDKSWVLAKVQSALKRKYERDGNLSDEVKDWILSSTGVFLSSDVVRCLQVSSRDDRKNISKIFSRLVADGLIERVGDRDGCFRRVESDYDVIDLAAATVEPLPVSFPFDLHAKVKTLKKSIIVVAGDTNAGKSAFALNFAFLNKEKFQVRYLTSEMGAEEIKSRVLLMGEKIETWKKIEFIERSTNFEDLILPDGITVVDYLEKSDDFYTIGQDIKNFFDNLKTGVCLLCLQKKRDQDFGRGGDFSAEKARLYLSMSPGCLKIVKAKNWFDPAKNPNNQTINFKLVSGIKFLPVSGWKDQE